MFVLKAILWFSIKNYCDIHRRKVQLSNGRSLAQNFELSKFHCLLPRNSISQMMTISAGIFNDRVTGKNIFFFSKSINDVVIVYYNLLILKYVFLVIKIWHVHFSDNVYNSMKFYIVCFSNFLICFSKCFYWLLQLCSLNRIPVWLKTKQDWDDRPLNASYFSNLLCSHLSVF